MEFLLDNGFESYFDEVAHANGRTGLSIGADLLFSRDQSAFKEFSSKYAKYLNSSIVERLEESTSISELSRLLIGRSQPGGQGTGRVVLGRPLSLLVLNL